MNVLVLSPNNRGVGVTTVAHSLAIALKHKGEFVQLMDINPKRPSFMKKFLSIPSNKGKDTNGMNTLIQMIRTGTITSEDMANCAVDLGVDTICVTPNTSAADIIEVASVTRTCEIQGRVLYTIIDVNTSDASSQLFKELLTKADVCVFVLDQSKTSIDAIADIKSANEASLNSHGIHVAYVVNKFEECALSLKDIWSQLNVKNTKSWFKVRYNRSIMQVNSKCLYKQYAEALHESADPDIANIKSDFDRVANYLVATGHKR